MTNIQPRKRFYRDITERDSAIFHYLWTWKVMSTKALAKFFPGAIPFTAYHRLWSLEKLGYLQSIQIGKPAHQVWGLGPKGYKFIRHGLGDLKQEGFKSEHPNHDHLATAFHLGEWLIGKPHDAEPFPEQKLRRVPMDLWPSWVPKTTSHRPDGYSSYVRDGKRFVIAFEIELYLKTKTRYEKLVRFYDDEVSIPLVFWLVDSRGTLNSLRKIFSEYHATQWPKHHFVLLSEFYKSGWATPFIEGRYTGSCIKSFLPIKHPTNPQLSTNCSGVQLLLDIKKRPSLQEPCRFAKNQKPLTE